MGSPPSFVDLKDPLGLEQENTSTADQSSSPQSSSPRSPVVGRKNGRMRSSSSPSTLHHISRYSPYPSALSSTSTRSLSPVSSSSDFESSPLSPTFSFSSRPRARKMRNKALHAAITYGSSSDLTADTPISTYVRRKTPGTSPTSPTFSPDSGYESSSSPTAMPFSIPSLPDLLANSSSSVPNSPSSESEFEDRVQTSFRSGVKRISKSNNENCRTVRRPTGVRISVPPYPSNLRERFMDL